MARASISRFALHVSATAKLRKPPELLALPVSLSKMRSPAFRRVAVLLPLAGALLLVPAGCKHDVEHGPDVWAVVNEIGRASCRERVSPYV